MLSRRKALRVLLPLAASCAVLLGAEAALRIRLGVPPPDREWPELDSNYSDIREDFFRLRFDPASRRAVYATNRRGAGRQEFLAVKPEGLVRIFVVGGSVAIGYVNEDVVRLREFLRKSVPGTAFEVIGCGMAGYDSYRDALIQREILAYHPDAIVLMSGNNEYYSPERVDPRLYRLTRALRKSWVFRLPLERLRARRSPGPPTLPERLANFEANLESMARRAKARGVPMIFCTLPANIRDVPPMRSPPPGDPAYFDARAALEEGDAVNASRLLEPYVRAHPSEPFGHYLLGRSLDRMRLYARAREQYLLALDGDDPGERCSPARNAIIRRVAKENGMILADLDDAFTASAEHRLPDGHQFADAMHWRNEYYPFVSWTILRSIYDSARSGGSFLSPAGRWRWGWFEREKNGILEPPIGAESLDEMGDEAIYKAMSCIVPTRGEFSEAALAMLDGEARRNPGRLDFLTRSYENVHSAFARDGWPPTDQFQGAWGAISLHVGEVHRRRREYAEALRFFGEARRQDPGADRPLLYEAATLFALGRVGEAGALLARVSAGSRDLPEFAYWRSRIGGGRRGL